MSENEYVATAAAEKRLREVLADRLPSATVSNVDDLAVALLDGAKIAYKARSREVTVSLTLPETGKTKTASKATVEPEAGVVTAPEGTPIAPTPHLAVFVPVALDPDAPYEDIHFD